MVGMSIPFMMTGLELDHSPTPGSPELSRSFEPPPSPESRPVLRPIVLPGPMSGVPIATLPAGLRSLNGNVAAGELQVMGAVASLKQRVLAPVSQAAPTGNPYASFFRQARSYSCAH